MGISMEKRLVKGIVKNGKRSIGKRPEKYNNRLWNADTDAVFLPV